jgi:DNA-binding NarL/FixJ family response regulator
MLSTERDIAGVDCVETTEAALERLQASAYDVVLVGARTVSCQQILRLRRAAIHQGQGTRVLVMDVPRSEEAILNYIQAGAAGYIAAGEPPHEIWRRVRSAAEGKALLGPSVAAALMTRIAQLSQMQATRMIRDSHSPSDNELTPREREVLELITLGLSNRDIADKLVVEVGTVKNHVHNILRKLGATNRYEVAANYPAWR